MKLVEIVAKFLTSTNPTKHPISAAGSRRGRASLAQKCSEIHHMRDLSPHRVAQMTVEWRAYRLARAENFNF